MPWETAGMTGTVRNDSFPRGVWQDFREEKSLPSL